MKFPEITCKITCGDEVHQLVLCEDGRIDLLNHDVEEEEALASLGESVSRCYNVRNLLFSDPNYVLDRASMNRETDLCKVAVAAGADVHHFNGIALGTAARNGDLATIKALLALGADIHCNWGTALRMAIQYKKIEAVKLLIENGADVNVIQGTPLSIASMKGFTEIAKLLLDSGAEIGINGSHPLNQAVNNHHVDVAQLLLDRGIDVRGVILNPMFFGKDRETVETIIKMIRAAGGNIESEYVDLPEEEWRKLFD